MNSVRICAFAFCGVCLAVLIKNWKSDFLPLLRLAVGIFFATLILTSAVPIVRYLGILTKETGLSSYTEILFKALGIAVLTECSAELCRECGETGIGNGVELAGKIEILLLSLPLMEKILSVAKDLLSFSF